MVQAVVGRGQGQVRRDSYTKRPRSSTEVGSGILFEPVNAFLQSYSIKPARCVLVHRKNNIGVLEILLDPFVEACQKRAAEVVLPVADDSFAKQ